MPESVAELEKSVVLARQLSDRWQLTAEIKHKVGTDDFNVKISSTLFTTNSDRSGQRIKITWYSFVNSSDPAHQGHVSIGKFDNDLSYDANAVNW